MSLPVNDNGKEWKQCVCTYLLILWTSCSKRCPKPKTRIDAATHNGGVPLSSQYFKEMALHDELFDLEGVALDVEGAVEMAGEGLWCCFPWKKKDFFGTSA